MQPRNEDEFADMLWTMANYNAGPIAVRYPRGAGPGVAIERELKPLAVGKGEIRRDSRRRTHRLGILAFGSMLHPALAAAEEIDATVANMRFVKPIDTELIIYLARTHEALVTIEEALRWVTNVEEFKMRLRGITPGAVSNFAATAASVKPEIQRFGTA